MGQFAPIKIAGRFYDPETVELLRGVLDEIWSDLTEAQRMQLPRSQIAEWLLSAAAAGERNAEALRIYVLDRFDSAAIWAQPSAG